MNESERLAVRAPLPLVPASEHEAAARAPARPLGRTGPLRLVCIPAAILLFGLALELLKSGALGLRPLLRVLEIEGALNVLGLGWVGAYLSLSGSPVAATALSLFSGGVLTAREAFFMINGSRLGASLIVVLVGFIYYLRGRRQPDGIYVGVVALLTTATIYLPAMLLGSVVLDAGWADGVRFGPATDLTSVSDVLYKPVAAAASAWLPRPLLFLLGLGILLGSFSLFDRALPSPESVEDRLSGFGGLLRTPWGMFGAGLLVTSVTLSVSLSVTILVPLALAGLVRREETVPYVMGANITTFVDTLFAALLLAEPRAFTVVLVEMGSVTAVSLVVLCVGFGRYRGAILTVAERATRGRRSLAVFLAVMGIIPLVLLAL